MVVFPLPNYLDYQYQRKIFKTSGSDLGIKLQETRKYYPKCEYPEIGIDMSRLFVDTDPSQVYGKQGSGNHENKYQYSTKMKKLVFLQKDILSPRGINQ